MKMILLAFFLISVLTTNAHALDESDLDFIQRGQSASMALGKKLKGRLTQALEQGDLNLALAICHDEAPRIAEEVSLETGVAVRRISPKTRNPDNQPDAWETEALAILDQKLADDTPAPQLETHAWLEQADGTREFHMLKGIVTEPMCLSCHGPAVDPAVLQAIRSLYPEDLATGFLPGSLRGAFSVRISK